MSKKRGLGKGLNALLSGSSPDIEQDPVVSADDEVVHQIEIKKLSQGRYQPRRAFDDGQLDELADSIRRQGVLQPIVVRAVAAGYEIVAGERRWRASRKAGLKRVPCLVRAINDHQAAAIGLIENLQRADLSPLEEAGALARLQQEFELTHQDVADVVGRSRASVSNLLRLLELEPPVMEKLNQGQIEMGHARALLAIKGVDQVTAAQAVVDKGLNVRQTEALVRGVAQPPMPDTVKDPVALPWQSLAEQLSASVGHKAQIKFSPSGRGKVEISFKDANEMESFVAGLLEKSE